MSGAPALAPATPVIGDFRRRTDNDTGFPATKVLVIALFSAALFTCMLIALFLIITFYRRRAMARNFPHHPGTLAAPGVPVEPIAPVELKQGFIIENPDGGEQVAYISSEKPEADVSKVEMVEVIIDDGDNILVSTSAPSPDTLSSEGNQAGQESGEEALQTTGPMSVAAHSSRPS